MYIKRYPTKHFHSDSASPLKEAVITRVWAQDGWCYIPQLLKREKFTEEEFFEESWDGVIPIPVYSETLIRTIYSMSPRIWREKGEEFDEIFEETTSTHSM